ncbi:ABC transporter substrate-binding protein [Chondromyces crocatus]|uniref:ABC transporter substrate-binding protein n=1 Tax=Chondromyces crocatus TaxID=52 RepID=UPI0012E22671|nr:ABC transporter substrate-binding protein [Chondromyces crocatus]
MPFKSTISVPASSASRSLRRLAPLFAAFALPLGAGGCSLIVEQSTTQCETNDDCVSFPGAICSAEKVCVSSANAACSTNQECVSRLGNNYVCVPSAGTCKSLVSEQCQTIVGTPAPDDAIILGSIAPTTGVDEGIGVPIENAARVAVHDFRDTAAQIADRPRQLVMVGCTDDSSSETARTATRHLLSLDSPAIIGAAFSGITMDIKDETIAAGTLLMSPSATAVGLGDLVDKSLVWRTAPPDTYQAQAIALYISQYLEGQVAESPLKVAVLHRGDDYGRQLRQALENELILNGQRPTHPTNSANYLRFDYGDPDNPDTNPPKLQEAVNAALTSQPHIVVLVGYSEAVNDIFVPLEKALAERPPATTTLPYYVMTDGVVSSDLWDTIGTNNTLRKRVSGTTPGRARSNPVFQAFAKTYKARFDDGGSEVFGAAEAYDAVYVLGYAAATLGTNPVTGPGLAEGIGKLIPPGTPIDAGAAAIPDAITRLRAGEKIDFTGASGPLDFDLGKGEAAGDIQIWCIPSGLDGRARSNILAGLFLDAADPGTLKGSLSSACD